MEKVGYGSWLGKLWVRVPVWAVIVSTMLVNVTVLCATILALGQLKPPGIDTGLVVTENVPRPWLVVNGLLPVVVVVVCFKPTGLFPPLLVQN
jgi:hypothetical protein